MIFHGVNVVVKTHPYIPTMGKFDSMSSLNDEDIQYLKRWGFNFVRLGVMWDGYETSLGIYNNTYLEETNKLINKLGESGIYTQIDLHQDALSRRTCGEGVPIFYTKNVAHTCWNNGLGFIAQVFGICNNMNG